MAGPGRFPREFRANSERTPNSEQISEDFSLLVAFLLVTFPWLFRGPLLSRKTVFGPFSLLFRGFFVAFSWPLFWAKFTRTRPGTVFRANSASEFRANSGHIPSKHPKPSVSVSLCAANLLGWLTTRSTSALEVKPTMHGT